MKAPFDIETPNYSRDNQSKIIISEWLTPVGGPVSEGENLVSLTTDQNVYTIKSPINGTLKKINHTNGSTVSPGDVLGVIEPIENTHTPEGLPLSIFGADNHNQARKNALLRRTIGQIREFLINAFYFAVGLVFLGLLFFAYSHTDHYARTVENFKETTESRERERESGIAISNGRLVGGEGAEKAVTLSALLADRALETNEDEIVLLDRKIDQLTDEINTLYFRHLSQNRRKNWEISVGEYNVLARLPLDGQSREARLKEMLRPEYCYEAVQNEHWETADGHCIYHALRNDVESQYLAGLIYTHGLGVTENHLYGYAWFMIAADNLHESAQEKREQLSGYLYATELQEARRIAAKCVNSSFQDCNLDVDNLGP